MAKEKMYRIKSLPGIKECIDYMRGAKSGGSKTKVKSKDKNNKKGY